MGAYFVLPPPAVRQNKHLPSGFSFSLGYTHTHTHTHTLSLSLSRAPLSNTLTLSLSLALALSLGRSLGLSPHSGWGKQSSSEEVQLPPTPTAGA